jgi:hypothetical protein
MANICENVTEVVAGIENYFLCSATHQKCCFQRYCLSEERVINTEGAKTCKARTKKIEEEINEVVAENATTVEPETLEEDVVVEITPNKKKTGVVTLITNTCVIYDCEGNSRFKQGHFNLKVGDTIED